MKVVVSISLFVSLIGIVMGPIGWISSYVYHMDLYEFENGGIEIEGQVQDRREWSSGRAYKSYIDILYTIPNSKKTIIAKDIEIDGLYHDAIRINDEIPLLYKNGEVLAVDDFKPEYTPPIKKKYWGMLLTIFSISFITYRVIDTKRKKARGEIPG